MGKDVRSATQVISYICARSSRTCFILQLVGSNSSQGSLRSDQYSRASSFRSDGSCMLRERSRKHQRTYLIG
ncbi:hypothetical protein RSAG8_13958, partial [Rhizoctonia solani AG-8 WAC10335]